MTDRLSQLYLDMTGPAPDAGLAAAAAAADGYILASLPPPEGLETDGKQILLMDMADWDMAGWRGAGPDPETEHDSGLRPAACICSAGLEQTARLRAARPHLAWIPRVSVTRAATAYHFPAAHYSESFRTYQPVFSSENPFRVDDGDRPLDKWLNAAAELGFSALWLHAPQAEAAGVGLDLDLREEALRTWSGHLWLSGGASSVMHVKYLVQEGGIDALVLPPSLAATLDCGEIRAALRRGVDRPPGARPDLPQVG